MNNKKKENLWTEEELDHAVNAYFDMLVLQLKNEEFSKTDIRNKYLNTWPNKNVYRSRRSFELRMCNISYVMINNKLPHLHGYLPAQNIGRNVEQIVSSLILKNIHRIGGIKDYDLVNNMRNDGENSDLQYYTHEEKLIIFNKLINTKIKELIPLSTRISNNLAKNQIIFFSQLINMSEKRLLFIPEFGRKSLNELKLNLANLGLSLNGASEDSFNDLSREKIKIIEELLEDLKSNSFVFNSKKYTNFSDYRKALKKNPKTVNAYELWSEEDMIELKTLATKKSLSDLAKHFKRTESAIASRLAEYIKISDIWDLSVRTKNCLKQMNINYAGQLIRMSRNQLLQIPNFGRSSLKEIEKNLEKINLRLEMLDNDFIYPTSITNGKKSLSFIPAYIKSQKDTKISNIENFDQMFEFFRSKITEREAEIIIKRIKGMTLEEIGSEQGVTRERIRQIQSKGFRKLNHPTRRFNKDFIHRELKWIEDNSPCKKSKFFERNNITVGGFSLLLDSLCIDYDKNIIKNAFSRVQSVRSFIYQNINPVHKNALEQYLNNDSEYINTKAFLSFEYIIENFDIDRKKLKNFINNIPDGNLWLDEKEDYFSIYNLKHKIYKHSGGPLIAALKKAVFSFDGLSLESLCLGLKQCRNFNEEIDTGHLEKFLINSDYFYLNDKKYIVPIIERDKLYDHKIYKLGSFDNFIISLFKKENKQILPVNFVMRHLKEFANNKYYYDSKYSDYSVNRYSTIVAARNLINSPLIFIDDPQSDNLDKWDSLFHDGATCNLLNHPERIIDSNIDFIEIDDIAGIEGSSTVVKVDLSKEEIERSKYFFDDQNDSKQGNEFIHKMLSKIENNKLDKR